MKRRALLVTAVFLGALFTGIIPISIGVGSWATSVNTVMSPLVCPGEDIVPAWKYRGRPAIASGPELRTRWICVDDSGKGHAAGYRTIVTAGTVYAVLLTIAFFAIAWLVRRRARLAAGSPSRHSR